jgi:hypothetical protein
MKRLLAFSAVLLAVLTAPTVALAAGDDPLLSGYGGPGSGDQAVLGGGLVGGGGSGSGGAGSASLRAKAPSAPVPSSQATSSPGAASSGTRPRVTKHRATKHKRAHTPSLPSTATAAPTSAAGPAKLPRLAPSPVAADRSSAGTLPLSTRDLLLALVVALAIAALAVATRRLARGFPGAAGFPAA